MPAFADTPLRIPLAEVLGAFSYALDLTEGQPEGHCLRTCWIGTHIGQEIGLQGIELWELYYTLLLKDLGCSSNAARIAQLYLTDDRSFKRESKTLKGGAAAAMNFVINHAAAQMNLSDRLRTIGTVMRGGNSIVRDLIETRCTRGADIAGKLRFSQGVRQGIFSLDEHWDGSGHPQGLIGHAIPLYSRIALLSQVIDAFFTSVGKSDALEEAQTRSGTWFDPDLVAAFSSVAQSHDFWVNLAAPDLEQKVLAMAPGLDRVIVDDPWMDDITDAFGQVIDAKSPYTSGHSERVGDYALMIGERLGIDAPNARWLRRAAILHDVGKLGVSSQILEKPGPLDEDEWIEMRAHAMHSHQILSRITAFGDLAQVASSHHERLDGSGYPHGLSGNQISLETRIITIADYYDALSADRPYRNAMSANEALGIIARDIGSSVDPRCYVALVSALGDLGEDLPGARTLKLAVAS